MTYLEYHLWFTLPPLLLLILGTWRERHRGVAGSYAPNKIAWGFFWGMPLIATLYTTPWDNYLIYKKVWTYPIDRVLATLGYVPIEEHLFFIVQPIITGLWLFFLLRREKEHISPVLKTKHRVWGSLLFGVISLIGAALLSVPHGFYMGLILVWAGPVLAFQWAFGGDLILSRPRAFWIGLCVPTLYLWCTDTLAISKGIWDISRDFSFGIRPFGLPVEEAVFFAVTNLLIVQGLLLFLHPMAQERFQKLVRSVQPWGVCLVLFAFLKIPVPLWPQGFPILATLSTGFLALSALLWAWQHVGVRALGLAVVCFGLGFGMELLGSQTGFPFGHYTYLPTEPNILGIPLMVPLGWWAMTLSATAVSRGRPWIAGALMVFWDFGLEPLMVAQNYWQWDSTWGNAYYGVPVVNFLGWYLTATGLSALIIRFAPQLTQSSSFGWAYRIESLFLPLGLLLMGFYPAGILTFVTMFGVSYALSNPNAKERQLQKRRVHAD